MQFILIPKTGGERHVRRKGKDPSKIKLHLVSLHSSLELFYTHQTFIERVMGNIQTDKVCLKAVLWILDSFLKGASELSQHKLNYSQGARSKQVFCVQNFYQNICFSAYTATVNMHSKSPRDGEHNRENNFGSPTLTQSLFKINQSFALNE